MKIPLSCRMTEMFLKCFIKVDNDMENISQHMH